MVNMSWQYVMVNMSWSIVFMVSERYVPYISFGFCWYEGRH